MRWAQSRKFEHGFLSGGVYAEREAFQVIIKRNTLAVENESGRSITSLGGSYLQANGTNMSVAGKIAISAAIGGTAEALGGGKFANGAVTGAYVMAWNHMREQIQDKRQRSVPTKEWLENKANEAIEAEKAKIDNWIKGGGGATNVDLNYNDYSNSHGAFNLYNDPVTVDITLKIDGKE